METLTHPDGFEVDYNYDVLGRPTSVIEGTTTLESVSYDDHGRRASLSYGNGTSVDYAYDGAGRLDALDWDLNGTGEDFSYDMAFTPSSQLSSLTVSDTSLAWVPAAASVDDYTANGLNQYTDIEGTSVSYDANGNITTDHRGRDYVYAADNRLMRVLLDGGEKIYLRHYADGLVSLRSHYSGGWTSTRLYYDGDQEIAEYSDPSPLGGSDADLLRRYIRLPGSVDEVLLMIDYTRDDCSTDYAACEVWAHHDRLGSTVKTSDSMGNEIDSYTYSKYGESGPEGDSGFPFRFTGQKLDPVTGLYNYKARWYDPETGRFLQTDPIGYADGMNMYAYTGNDPVNGRDPSGLSNCDRAEGDGFCNEGSGGGGGGGFGTSDVIIVVGHRLLLGALLDAPATALFGGGGSAGIVTGASGAFRGGSGGEGPGKEEGETEERRTPKCNQSRVDIGNQMRETAHGLSKAGATVGLTGVALFILGAPEVPVSAGLSESPGAIVTTVGAGMVAGAGTLDLAGGIVQGANGGGFTNAKQSGAIMLSTTAVTSVFSFIPAPAAATAGAFVNGVVLIVRPPEPVQCHAQ